MCSSTVRPRTCTTATLAPTWRHSFHSGMESGGVSAPRRDAVRTSPRSWPGTMRRLRTGLILGFGLWRGLMLDRLPVLGQPAPHALDQRNRIGSPLLWRHLTEQVLERARHVDLLPVAP